MMSKKILFASLSVLLFAGILLNNTLPDVFSLEQARIAELVSGTDPGCSDILSCELHPGDILIRRHLTDRTRLAASIFDAYFTHSAMYIGDNNIVEAVGNEPDPQNEVLVRKYSESDWTQEDAESWVILRPQVAPDQAQALSAKMAELANDPEYTFGAPWPIPRNGKVSCADLILNQLAKHGVAGDVIHPEIVTPDYLASYTLENRDLYKVVGYKL